jgi:hypothetical protein
VFNGVPFSFSSFSKLVCCISVVNGVGKDDSITVLFLRKFRQHTSGKMKKRIGGNRKIWKEP